MHHIVDGIKTGKTLSSRALACLSFNKSIVVIVSLFSLSLKFSCISVKVHNCAFNSVVVSNTLIGNLMLAAVGEGIAISTLLS